MSYIKRSSEWTKWKSKKLQWPQVGKRSYFGWSVIQFSSWGLIQPLDLESPHSEHKECIKLLRTFGWRGVRSLFYLTCGKNLTPKRLSKDPLSVLITSLLCSVLDLTLLALHTISVPQHSGVGASCGTTVALALWSKWEGPSCFFLRCVIHLHFWEMEIHISLGHPSTPPKTGAAVLHASICAQFMLLDLKYKEEGSRQEWNLSSWRM